MQPTQAVVVSALIIFAILGVGTIALIAYLGARNSSDDLTMAPETSPLDAVEKALMVHREHIFLQRHPEWSGRDFRSDKSSPWHTEFEEEDARMGRSSTYQAR
ncbi:hypothetical protein [Fimbriimonas ginsengisoli]|nr:hypothetical protein [Fimbriimonas ginsengisoli]